MCVMHQELEAANGGGRGAQLGSQFPGVAAPPTPLHPALASVLDATSMAALGVVSAAGAGLCLMGTYGMRRSCAACGVSRVCEGGVMVGPGEG